MLTQAPNLSKSHQPPFPLVMFLLISAAALWGQAQHISLPFKVAVKIVPIALLLLWAAKGVREDRSGYRFGIALGLAASLAGDIWIEFNFIAGIAAFLVAQLLYVVAMGANGVFGRGQAAALVPGVALWGGMFLWLTPRVPAELFVPVVAYLTVISLMWTRALGRALHLRSAAAWTLLAGASFFVVSDSLIAINRWVVPVPYEQLAIMATYYAAQVLIGRSLHE